MQDCVGTGPGNRASNQLFKSRTTRPVRPYGLKNFKNFTVPSRCRLRKTGVRYGSVSAVQLPVARGRGRLDMLQRSSRATQRPFGKTPPRGFCALRGPALPSRLPGHGQKFNPHRSSLRSPNPQVGASAHGLTLTYFEMVVKEIYHELGPFKLFSWRSPICALLWPTPFFSFSRGTKGCASRIA